MPQEILTLNIRNASSFPVTLTPNSFAFGGPDAQYFSMHTAPPVDGVVLNPSDEVEYEISYAPTASGTHNSILYITTNTPVSASIPLTGSGVKVQLLARMPNAVEYFEYERAGTTVSLPIQIRNNGERNLTVTALSIVSVDLEYYNNPSQIVNLPATPFTVAPGQTHTIGVLEVDVENYDITTGVVRVTHDSPVDNGVSDVAAVVTLKSTSSHIEFNASTFAFGNVNPNTQYTFAGVFQVRAPASNVLPVTVTGIVFGNSQASITGTSFPFTLNPGQTRNITLRFKSTQFAVGLQSISATINTNNPFVTKTGAVVTANVLQVRNLTFSTPNGTVFPNRLPVGNIHPVPRIARFTASATNNVNATVTPEQLVQNFTPGIITPIAVAPGQTVDIPINFTPKDWANGVRTGNVRFVTNSNLGTFNHGFSGTANRVRVDPQYELLFSHLHDVSSANNVFGAGETLKNGAVWLDNRDNDYPAVVNSINVGTAAIAPPAATLTANEISMYVNMSPLPFSVPANGSRLYRYFIEPNPDGDTRFWIAPLNFIGPNGAPTIAHGLRIWPSEYIDMPAENLFIAPLAQVVNDAVFNIAGNPSPTPHGTHENGYIELPTFMHQYPNEWYEFKIRNDGTANLEIKAQFSFMFHLTPEIDHNEEPTLWVLNNMLLDLGGLQMYYDNRVLAQTRANGGRHPNNTYWMIDSTQEHLGGNNYTNFIIAPGDIRVVARIRKVRANAPPVLIGFRTNSSRSDYIQFIVAEKGTVW
jgi:hypothetical protein